MLRFTRWLTRAFAASTQTKETILPFFGKMSLSCSIRDKNSICPFKIVTATNGRTQKLCYFSRAFMRPLLFVVLLLSAYDQQGYWFWYEKARISIYELQLITLTFSIVSHRSVSNEPDRTNGKLKLVYISKFWLANANKSLWN